MNYGPVFGNDLCICNKANKNNYNFGNINNIY
jgi:hypothetical protein